MIRLQEICRALSEELKAGDFPDAGPNGLQVEGKEEVRKVGTAVSASLATIEAAVSRGMDCLVVHHGLFWKGEPYPIVGTKKEKIKLLIENGISLIAYHLPLDAHPSIGNNWRAAKELGWENLQPFGEYNGVEIGVRGTFDPVPREEFVRRVEEYYGHHALTANGGKERVSSCALISGGAWKAVGEAARAGVDCFITGNFDEPAWHLAFEEGINFMALGHSATEKIGPKALAEYLGKRFSISAEFIDIPNPF